MKKNKNKRIYHAVWIQYNETMNIVLVKCALDRRQSIQTTEKTVKMRPKFIFLSHERLESLFVHNNKKTKSSSPYLRLIFVYSLAAPSKWLSIWRQTMLSWASSVLFTMRHVTRARLHTHTWCVWKFWVIQRTLTKKRFTWIDQRC